MSVVGLGLMTGAWTGWGCPLSPADKMLSSQREGILPLPFALWKKNKERPFSVVCLRGNLRTQDCVQELEQSLHGQVNLKKRDFLTQVVLGRFYRYLWPMSWNSSPGQRNWQSGENAWPWTQGLAHATEQTDFLCRSLQPHCWESKGFALPRSTQEEEDEGIDFPVSGKICKITATWVAAYLLFICLRPRKLAAATSFLFLANYSPVIFN